MSIDPRFGIEDVFSRSMLRTRRAALDPPASSSERVGLSMKLDTEILHNSQSYEHAYTMPSSQSCPSFGPPPWLIGFPRQFKKDTRALDRKLMGRILEVLEELSDYDVPFHAQGDTFKPLKGDLEGCWRYRIGDGRLVIQPEQERAQLNAIAF